MNAFNKHLFLSLFLVTIATVSVSQNRTNDFGNWIMYNGANKVSEKWSIHTEIQWRSHTIEPNIEQLLTRIGMNYHFDKNNSLTAGYGYITNHPYDKEVTSHLSTEHRIWQQFITKNSLWRLFFEHRYRLEQRWISNSYSIKHRARYRIMINIPLNKATIGPQTFFVTIYDEPFINIQRNRVFDRNRLYGALGYQFNSSTNLQIGVMNQALEGFNKYHFQMGLVFNPELYKEKEEN